MIAYWAEKFGRIAAAWSVAAFFGLATFMLWNQRNLLLHVDGAVKRVEGIETHINTAAQNIADATGDMSDTFKDEQAALGEFISDTDKSAQKANTALDSLNDEVKAFQKPIDAAAGLMSSAQRATDQLPNTLTALNGAISNIGDLAGTGNDSLNEFNAFLKSEALKRSAADFASTIHNVAGMTDSGNAILGDAQKVADKETADWLTPVPWWKQPIKKGGALIDIGAAIARHTP